MMTKDEIRAELEKINNELLELSNQLDSVALEIKNKIDSLVEKRDALAILEASPGDANAVLKAVSILSGESVGTPGNK